MIILASKSPRRIELLRQIVEDFKIIPADINEKEYSIEDVAFEKGKKIHELYPDDIIIASDTFILFKGEIINKPKDKKDAYQILKKLSGLTHQVITYYCIFNRDYILKNHVVTKVKMNKLSDELILSYIEDGSPLDKAGAYGIQDNDRFPIIDSIDGEKENVIGLPIKELKADLIKLGIIND